MLTPAQTLSIVIPTLNEAAHIAETLLPLQSLRSQGHEIIVVDGGSQDSTVERARPLVDHVFLAPRGRAAQMNAGARLARGDILVFLHADTRLPEHTAQLIERGLATSATGWGRFDVRLSGAQVSLRIVEYLINWRSRLSGIATGDQVIFVRRAWFEAAGAYPEIALMEDIALSRTLKRRAPPLGLRQCVITSSRRWEQRGVWKTILLMWSLRIAYAVGVDPQRLARSYDKAR